MEPDTTGELIGAMQRCAVASHSFDDGYRRVGGACEVTEPVPASVHQWVERELLDARAAVAATVLRVRRARSTHGAQDLVLVSVKVVMSAVEEGEQVGGDHHSSSPCASRLDRSRTRER